MNDNTGGNRGPRRAGTLAVVAAVAVLATACGVHVSFSGGPAPARSETVRAKLAYAHCMQTHGVPNFPEPNSLQGYSISGHITGKGNGPVARANDACQQLLSGRTKLP